MLSYIFCTLIYVIIIVVLWRLDNLNLVNEQQLFFRTDNFITDVIANVL